MGILWAHTSAIECIELIYTVVVVQLLEWSAHLSTCWAVPVCAVGVHLSLYQHTQVESSTKVLFFCCYGIPRAHNYMRVPQDVWGEIVPGHPTPVNVP